MTEKPENTEPQEYDIEAIKRAEAEAVKMAEMRSSFLAVMSHEIRTPMQSVYGLLELVVDEQISDNAREMIKTARKSASDLLEILDGILDLAKVEAGKVELDFFEIPIRTLTYGVLEGMVGRLMGKNITFTPEIDDDIPFVIMGDPTRLRQILINLVGNAVKFTECGDITVRVSQKVQNISPPEDGLGLRFEISDTGIGMSDEVAARLFQPYSQASNATTRKFGGTGLGLSISHKLIELMGGQIGVDSVEEAGSTFWFEIPTFPANEQNVVDLPDLDGIAVLSVEDHPRGAKEILSSLTSMGAKVESVPTYAEGLELIKRRRFDVAIIDQGLPDGEGIDLLKEAAKFQPFMGLILYTVHDDFSMQYTAKVTGAKYLSKPASRLGLGEAVRDAAVRMNDQEYTGPRRLLIAEDTLSVQDILRRQLKKVGIEADFVNNGIEALRALEKEEHGILFTDLHMPDMDGYQLVSEIRAQEDKDGVDQMKRFPVIVLTADVQMAQRQAYLAHGFDECLLKPVSLGQFKQLLIRWGVLRESTKEADQNITGALESEDPTLAPAEEITETTGFAVDRDMLISHLGGLDEDSINMLHMFIDMTRPQLKEIKDAFDANDQKTLRGIAHSFKGAARSACCLPLGDAASIVQDNLENDKPVTSEMIDKIEIEFNRAEKEINALKPA